jgi:hypothetical protein
MDGHIASFRVRLDKLGSGLGLGVGVRGGSGVGLGKGGGLYLDKFQQALRKSIGDTFLWPFGTGPGSGLGSGSGLG